MNARLYLIPFVYIVGLLLSSCGGGGGSSSTKDDPLPKEISLSVSLPKSFNVTKGEMFEIQATGTVIPFHPAIKLNYKWDRLTYKKSLATLLVENDGNMDKAVATGVREAGFATGQKITEIAPDVAVGGYVIYSVSISAEGYIIDADGIGKGPRLSTVQVTLSN